MCHSFCVLPRIALILAVCCAGCANFHSSHIMIGSAATPVAPEQVQIYLRPPAGYEEVAMVSANSRGSFSWSQQRATDLALQRLTQEAAKLGANGLLNLSFGEPWSAAPVLGTGLAYGWGGYPTGYGLGASVGVPALVKSATALAIRVRER
jgi:hypothetical protein